MSQPLLFSGARGKVSYTTKDGVHKTLGLALDVNVSRSYGQQQTYVIGSYNPVAIDSTSIDVSVSLSRVIPVNEAGDSSKIASDRLTAIDLGLEVSIQDALTSEALTLDITDRITDKIIASVREMRFAGGSLGNPAQGLATERLNFIGTFDAGYNGANAGAKLGYDSNQS